MSINVAEKLQEIKPDLMIKGARFIAHDYPYFENDQPPCTKELASDRQVIVLAWLLDSDVFAFSDEVRKQWFLLKEENSK